MKYVALLRGINVGGKNIIKMEQLKLAKSALVKLASKKIYQDMTIRNYNTTQKLLALMERT
jgi:uncharacterized protein (DUF1697 family)